MAMSARAEWTVDMLDALPDDGQRYELVDGVVHVTPAPGLNHQLIAGHLHYLLKLYLSGSTVGRPLISPSDVRRGDRTRNRVQPDVFVVRLADSKLPRYPFAMADLLLAVEVSSPNDPAYDYQTKRALYIANGYRGSFESTSRTTKTSGCTRFRVRSARRTSDGEINGRPTVDPLRYSFNR